MQDIQLASFPQACKKWRLFRKLSQLELALEANVSQRHLSYLETGRSHPSREMVIRLSEALDIPLRERNTLLRLAGYSNIYQETRLTEPQMTPIFEAVNRVLDHHEPYPAIVIDRFWNVIQANTPATYLFGLTLDPSARSSSEPLNIALMTLHPNGMRRFISNWNEILPLLVKRLRSEALASGDPEVQEKLMSYLTLVEGEPLELTTNLNLLPVMPLELAINGSSLSFFSVISTFGTPQDVTTDELRIETFYPTDQTTRDFFSALPSTLAKDI